MLHNSLTVHTNDPDIDLATDPEVLKVIDGYAWNEFDVQHLRDSGPSRGFSLTLFV